MPPSPEHQINKVSIESMQEMEYFKKLDEHNTQELTQSLLLETSTNIYAWIRESVATLFETPAKSTP